MYATLPSAELFVKPQALRVALTRRVPVLLLLAVCGFLFFWGLGDRDLLSSHEARAAQNGQMIVSEGCWGLPHLFDRHLEMQKPPLYYWLVALLGHLLGGQVDAWAVRLPAALSALTCVLFVYYLGRLCGRARAGLLAALVLASCLHFTWLARVGRIDMPLTLTVALAGGGFYLGMTRKRGRTGAWFLLAYVSVALGILLKGPIALVLTGAIVGAFAFLVRRSEGSGAKRPMTKTLSASLWWGLPLVFLIAAPWFIWANYETNNQIWEVFFYYHNIERGLGGSDTLASYPFWFYVPRALIDLFPWSVALPAAAWWWYRSTKKRHARALALHTRPGNSEPALPNIGERDRLASFGALWFLSVFGVLSCMSFKRADYLLPAYPGAALFLGCVGERFWRLKSVRFEAIVGALLALCALGWGIYNVYLVPRQEAGWPYRQLAHDIRAHTQMPVIFFRAESHVLAFHVDRPLDTILEWENLDVWASRPETIYFIMPPDCARDWPRHLTRGRLEEVFRTSDHPWGKRERPFVVMRSCPAL